MKVLIVSRTNNDPRPNGDLLFYKYIIRTASSGSHIVQVKPHELGKYSALKADSPPLDVIIIGSDIDNITTLKEIVSTLGTILEESVPIICLADQFRTFSDELSEGRLSIEYIKKEKLLGEMVRRSNSDEGSQEQGGEMGLH